MMKEREKAKEMVAKGWGAGPFSTPPVPFSRCRKQAILTRAFTIPKHKWADDGSLRLIFHKSFPRGISINNLTPRHDASTYYPEGKFVNFTVKVLICKIAKAGKGSLLFLFDAKDAYKQLRIRVQDLHQQ